MGSELEVDAVDMDGAIREAAGEVTGELAAEGDTRLEFLKKAGLAGGGIVAGGALLGALVPGTAAANGRRHGRNGNGHGYGGLDRPPREFGRGDVGILNYALTLEYLEAAFYNEARKKMRFKKLRLKDRATRDFLEVVVRDENAHVEILKGILGKKAVEEPKFEFGRTTRDEDLFVETAFALENVGVGAYLGQAFNIDEKAVLAGALSIATVEARHAGLIGQIVNGAEGIAPNGPTDELVGARETLRAVEQTGFITG